MMEKISAACAMEWSIELEKGLRSKKPGRRVEVIEQIGHKLQQWSREPSITIPISDIYSLVPGEERLFANAILLRLADTFRCGDNHTRGYILKTFLLESKKLIKMGKKYDGILAKRRVPNYVELLKRIKTVFDTGDAEAKALALSLFGCCADLAKDSAEIRYVILLGLQSSNDSEVKASLFAAGCFCRLSEDFTRIFMEMLISLISSPQASSDVKLEAVRAFSKMRCSSTTASRAYKAGNRLITSLQQDECKAEMLSSLSKLAYYSSLLILEQMDLLLSFLSCESSSLVRARALKCICFLANRGACRFPFTETVLVALLDIIDDNELPPNFHCEALRILCKIFHLSDFFGIRMPAFFKLILIVETAAKSSVKEKRCLALRLLVDSLCSMKRELQTHWYSNPEKWHDILFQFHVSLPAGSSCSGEDGPTLLVCHVILLIINRINFLMDQTIVLRYRKHILIPHDGLPEAKLEFKSLFNLILRLAREYPSSIQVALDKIRCLISMVDSHNWKSSGTGGEASEIELGGEIQNPILSTKSDYGWETSAFSELMLYLYRFMDACLSILDESGSFNSEVYHLVKLFIDCIQQSRYCTFDLYEIFCLHIHAYVLSRSCEVTNNCIQDFSESVVAVELGFSHNVCWRTQEVQALDFAKKMLKIRNHWTAYRVGKNSCCQGAWFTAAYTFRKLMGMVESNFLRCWIKSLMLLAGGESEAKLLLFPKVGTEMINAMQTEAYSVKSVGPVELEMNWYDGRDSGLCGSEGKLARVYSRIRASEESLAAAGASGGVYYFQRWFLSLRAKVLVSVVEMLGLLDSHTFTGEKSNKGFEGNTGVDLTQVSQTMHALASEFTQISYQFNNLAKEYDFLAVSFLDIDLRSFRSISSLSLSCSVLAFCTTFALYFLTTPTGSVESRRVDNKGEIIFMSIINDLFERLRNIDSILAAKLQRLMTVFEKATDNLYARTEVNSTSHTDRSVLLVYKYAILGVLNIQEDAKAVKDEESLCALVVRGLRLLSDIIRKWMEIPFRTPNYFFRVRPCVGSELFIFDTDARCTEGVSVPLGCQLSLNLSIQLVNVSKKSRTLVTEIYCILAVNSSDCLTSGAGERVKQEQSGFQACKTNEMVKLNEMLLQHMRTDTGNDIQKQCEINVDSMVTTFVHFELNGKGQGFSTCMIDVSALHEGSYQIKWHSCSVDKKHNYWSLLPMNPFPLFTIRKS